MQQMSSQVLKMMISWHRGEVMTQMQNFMLEVCFGATLGLIIGSWGFTIKCWLDDRKKKKTEEKNNESN